MGVSATDVGNLLSIAWAGRYVNDFIDHGRIKRVYVQGEAESRADALGYRQMARAQRLRRSGALLELRDRQLDLRPAGR